MRMRGFTLVEALISAVLLAIIFFVVVSLYPTSLLGLRKGHDLINASNLAQYTLEDFRGRPFSDLKDGSGTPTDSPMDGTVYHVETTVTPIHSDVKELKVKVSWKTGPQSNPNALPQSLTFVTRIFDVTNP